MGQAPRLDPYAVLGVPRTATTLQVARAHRRLAKRYHPDLNPGGDGVERMRRINEAWRLLSSPDARASYDRDHPAGAGTSNAHWVPPPRHIRGEGTAPDRSWASWRASAEETRAAPRTRRAPGELPVPPTRRPPRLQPSEHRFRDSGLAALLVAALILLLLLAAAAAGRLG